VQNEKAVVLSVIQKRESESLPRKGKKHRPITKRRYIWVSILMHILETWLIDKLSIAKRTKKINK
jgi:hypothetical protein